MSLFSRWHFSFPFWGILIFLRLSPWSDSTPFVSLPSIAIIFLKNHSLCSLSQGLTTVMGKWCSTVGWYCRSCQGDEQPAVLIESIWCKSSMDVNWGGMFYSLPASFHLPEVTELIVNSSRINSFLKHLGKYRTYFKRFTSTSHLLLMYSILLQLVLDLFFLPGVLHFSLHSFSSDCKRTGMFSFSVFLYIIYFLPSFILLFSGWGYTLWSAFKLGC